MASTYARKVDQQRLYANHIVDVIAAYQRQPPAAALIQAGYLQLEMALRFYLFELIGKKDADAVPVELLDATAFTRVVNEVSSPELMELAELSLRNTSWLATFIDQLSRLRQAEPSPTLRGAIFQVEEQPYDANMIALEDVSDASSPPNFEDLQGALTAFSLLVERHRAVSEEY